MGLLLYSNIVDAPFVLDDHHIIVENHGIRSLSDSFGNIKSNRYVSMVSFSLNYAVAGLDTEIYHLVNNVIHVINALLIYILVKLIFRTPLMKDAGRSEDFIAFSASLIFLVHPVQTQAVTYITQRFASLAALFYMLSLVFFIKARLNISMNRVFLSKKHVLYYSLCIVSAIFAMKTKEIAITLPLMIILFEIYFIKVEESRIRKIMYFLPVVLTLLIIPLSLLDLSKPGTDVVSDLGAVTVVGEDALSRSHYLFTQFRVVITYLRLLIFPINQNLYYDYPVYETLFAPEVMLSVFALTGFVIFAVLVRKRTPLLSFGILWFFITLSVESSVIPIRHVIFEHRLYLPSAGFIIAVSAVIERFVPRKTLRIILITSMVAALSFATFERNTLWEDPVKLWQDTVRKSPLNADARNGLGAVYMDAGLLKEAIAEFDQALLLNPGSATASYNLGKIYMDEGLTDRAIDSYLSALSVESHYADQIHNGLGLAYKSKGDYLKAVEHFQQAVALNPVYKVACYNLANTYSSTGSYQQAVENYERALRIDRDEELQPDIYNNLGLALSRKGETGRAIEIYQEAISLYPSYMAYYSNLGIEYMKINDIDKAIDILERGIKVKEQWHLYANLSAAWSRKGNNEKSRLAQQKALMLKQIQ